MNDLTSQQKGSLLAFIAVMFITPDSLFIRLSNIETWGMLFYRGAIPFTVVLIGFYSLGTDGFGRSDTRKNLRNFFEVDKEHVVTYGLSVLAKEQLIASKYAKEAIKKYKIDNNKPMPTKL